MKIALYRPFSDFNSILAFFTGNLPNSPRNFECKFEFIYQNQKLRNRMSKALKKV